jgi:hypothetical protein
MSEPDNLVEHGKHEKGTSLTAIWMHATAT